MFPDTYPGNNILVGTDWVKKGERFNNVSTTMPVKLGVDRLIYRNIPLKYMTKVGILDRMYSETIKSKFFVTIP